MNPVWNDAVRARVRDLVARSGKSQAKVAAAAGMSPSNLSNLLTSDSEPGVNRLTRLADALGTTVDHILTGAEAVGDDIALIPLSTDNQVSAGDGAESFDFEDEELVPFPKAWIDKIGARASDLRMIRVRGDSMTPTIRHGDTVMFDKSRSEFGDGVYVLLLDGLLAVKRIALFDAVVRVRSDAGAANPALYPEREIAGNQIGNAEIIKILGRVVWVGREM